MLELDTVMNGINELREGFQDLREVDMIRVEREKRNTLSLGAISNTVTDIAIMLRSEPEGGPSPLIDLLKQLITLIQQNGAALERIEHQLEMSR